MTLSVRHRKTSRVQYGKLRRPPAPLAIHSSRERPAFIHPRPLSALDRPHAGVVATYSLALGACLRTLDGGAHDGSLMFLPT
jgi:hypothetical protein